MRLGAFMFNGVPEVVLGSVAPDGNGSEDIAFDAVAFVPISGDYHEETVEAVAVFDEDQNIDTPLAASWLAGTLGDRVKPYDWGTRTSGDMMALSGCSTATSGCLPPATKAAASRWRDEVLAAGSTGAGQQSDAGPVPVPRRSGDGPDRSLLR
ncbi:hypothetical protein [Saccharothrix deserti]|uniref:hypothetical protein n=1 Tax=Saccharothrix deserti TaxID=2593674 RepID=UPI00131EAD16|nr:hypothetical protein [Saccharothrix deserti]